MNDTKQLLQELGFQPSKLPPKEIQGIGYNSWIHVLPDNGGICLVDFPVGEETAPAIVRVFTDLDNLPFLLPPILSYGAPDADAPLHSMLAAGTFSLPQTITPDMLTAELHTLAATFCGSYSGTVIRVPEEEEE